MTIFRNFKNQSHRFMTIFCNFMNQGVASHSKIDLRLRSSALARNTTHKAKMDKQRIRIATKILEVSGNCRIYRLSSRAAVQQRKEISGRGNFSFYMPRMKMLAQKNILYFVLLGFKV